MNYNIFGRRETDFRPMDSESAQAYMERLFTAACNEDAGPNRINDMLAPRRHHFHRTGHDDGHAQPLLQGRGGRLDSHAARPFPPRRGGDAAVLRPGRGG